jgi:lipopolysaccharide/colanic/teichoic acid biosynthesis glycosyltransferase
MSAKRAIDVVGAAVGLLLLTPLLLAAAVAVRLDSPGPALFRQRRAGIGGRTFWMWKFRTMVRGAERLRDELMAVSRDLDWLNVEADPRVTRVGRVLRRTSLDELPQLFNVLRGEMSLVGPRPLPLEEHARIPAWAAARLMVRPGMTGLWQVRGRAGTGFAEMLRLDCEYACAPSLRVDVGILLRTLPALLTGKGAN